MNGTTEERRERIMRAVDADDWTRVESEVTDAVVGGLIRDLSGQRVTSTKVKIEAETSDGRTVVLSTRLNTEDNMQEAVDGLGTVWASAATIEGLAAAVYGMRFDPLEGDRR